MYMMPMAIAVKTHPAIVTQVSPFIGCPCVAIFQKPTWFPDNNASYIRALGQKPKQNPGQQSQIASLVIHRKIWGLTWIGCLHAVLIRCFLPLDLQRVLDGTCIYCALDGTVHQIVRPVASIAPGATVWHLQMPSNAPSSIIL